MQIFNILRQKIYIVNKFITKLHDYNVFIFIVVEHVIMDIVIMYSSEIFSSRVHTYIIYLRVNFM